VGEAHVHIWRDGNAARISVEDSGIGFDPGARHEGFGLLALRERVGQMGGSVEIASAVGSGTRIVVSVLVASRDAGTDGGST
jgi:signal transduction histidine kinase